jgi:hypothetical protein
MKNRSVIMSNNYYEKNQNPTEKINIGDISTFLTENSVRKIINTLGPEALRKIADVVEYSKKKMFDVKLDSVSLYEQISILDLRNFGLFLKFAEKEYDEYQRLLSQASEEELSLWLGTPGKTTLPDIGCSLDMNDMDLMDISATVENIYRNCDGLSCEDYVSKCTWWGVLKRGERIAYVKWLKEVCRLGDLALMNILDDFFSEETGG